MILLVSILCACGTSDSVLKDTPSPVLKEPPKLNIAYGDITIAAALGTYSWHYEDTDGTTKGAEADSVHPLFMKNNPVIALNSENETLNFAFEAKPTAVKVCYWDEDCLEDDSKYFDFKELNYSYDTDSVQIPTGKSIVVMVEGTWENGTALYSFRT
ncbi:MAG: hypothetical protein IKZ39_07265, partial [Lachnospiraceae bacterium]|nr:hypothetical protein [Lachnospiraceae bacterium]